MEIIDYPKIQQGILDACEGYSKGEAVTGDTIDETMRDGFYHGEIGKNRVINIKQHLALLDSTADNYEDELLATMLAIFDAPATSFSSLLFASQSKRLAGLIANQLIVGCYRKTFSFPASKCNQSINNLKSEVFSSEDLDTAKNEEANQERHSVSSGMGQGFISSHFNRTKGVRYIINQVVEQSDNRNAIIARAKELKKIFDSPPSTLIEMVEFANSETSQIVESAECTPTTDCFSGFFTKTSTNKNGTQQPSATNSTSILTSTINLFSGLFATKHHAKTSQNESEASGVMKTIRDTLKPFGF